MTNPEVENDMKKDTDNQETSDECCHDSCCHEEHEHEAVQEQQAEEKTNKESDDWKNKAAYLAAEIENMKKRFDREKTEFLRYANEELLKKFLPVLDNMLLALKSVNVNKDSSESTNNNGLVSSLVKGFEMTLKHFEQTLESVGVEFIKSAPGTNFNPELHEAMGQEAKEELDDGVISSEFQRGFKLNGRVVRPARVMVNKLNTEKNDQKEGN